MMPLRGASRRSWTLRRVRRGLYKSDVCAREEAVASVNALDLQPCSSRSGDIPTRFRERDDGAFRK